MGGVGEGSACIAGGRPTQGADTLRDVVRDYALETLADPDAVLVIDETGFLKQGKSSCGVGRQYTQGCSTLWNGEHFEQLHDA